MAKKFFLVCAGILMLAGACTIGADRATAQVGQGDPVVGITEINMGSLAYLVAITADGNTYMRPGYASGVYPWEPVENVFGLEPVAVTDANLGDVKAIFR